MTEDEFLEKLFSRLPPPPRELVIPPGDDCAGLRIGEDRLLLVAVDQLIGARHYPAGPGAMEPELAGRKLLARNLSDIAAMGGEPLYCLVAAGLGPLHDENWLQRFFDGIIELGRQYGVIMIGGDLGATMNDDVASLTIIGQARETHVLRRRGAKPGDILFATGSFGSSLSTGHHLVFEPRCREGQWIARSGFARAMIDVSDGLLLDAGRMCRASGVGLRIDVGSIPLRSPETTSREALTDGEDYELLFAVPEGDSDKLQREWPFRGLSLTRIGEFTSFAGEVVDEKGEPLSADHPGYDHFQSVRRA
ncbi:MAG: thiamine-monophosphate kinase [Syntrophales bacterium]